MNIHVSSLLLAHHWICPPSSEPQSQIFWSARTVPSLLPPALVYVLAALLFFHLGRSTLHVCVTIHGRSRQETATPPTEWRLQNWQWRRDNSFPTNNICFFTLVNSESWLKHWRLKPSWCLHADMQPWLSFSFVDAFCVVFYFNFATTPFKYSNRSIYFQLQLWAKRIKINCQKHWPLWRWCIT